MCVFDVPSCAVPRYSRHRNILVIQPCMSACLCRLFVCVCLFVCLYVVCLFVYICLSAAEGTLYVGLYSRGRPADKSLRAHNGHISYATALILSMQCCLRAFCFCSQWSQLFPQWSQWFPQWSYFICHAMLQCCLRAFSFHHLSSNGVQMFDKTGASHVIW